MDMDHQSEIKESIDIDDTLVNVDIMRDKMNKVSNRIDKAITDLTNQKHEWAKDELIKKISMLEAKCFKDDDEIKQLKKGNVLLDKIINEKKTVISSLELSIKHWLRRYEQVQIVNSELSNKCSLLQESVIKGEREIEQRQKEIDILQEEVKMLKMKLESNEQKMKLYSYMEENKSGITCNIAQDNLVNVICTLSQVIGTINKELLQEKMEKERCVKNLEAKEVEVESLTQRLETITRELEARVFRENGAFVKTTTQADNYFTVSHEKPFNNSDSGARDLQNNVDNMSNSTESSKVVSDLQKVIHYKNSTITTLQSDVICKESLVAELENKLLNMTKELQISKRNFHQLCDVKKSPSLGW